jgi:membrane protein
MRILIKSFLDFFKYDGPIYAGSITGFFLMSFVPFCLLLVSIFGYLLSEHKEFFDFFLRHTQSLFPQAAGQITEMLSSAILYRQQGIFTAILYSYFSYQLYMALETSVNRIFGIESRRSIFVSIFFAVVFVILVTIVMLISFAVTSAISVPNLIERFLVTLRINKIATLIVGSLMTLLLSLLLISLLYVLLPIKRISLKHAVMGGAFTSCLIEAAKHIFTFYMMRRGTHYGAIYGPLTAFVIFLLWILYASSIFLIGAALVHNLDEKKEKGGV